MGPCDRSLSLSLSVAVHPVNNECTFMECVIVASREGPHALTVSQMKNEHLNRCGNVCLFENLWHSKEHAVTLPLLLGTRYDY